MEEYTPHRYAWLSGSARATRASRAGLAFFLLGIACRLHVYLLSFPLWRDEASLALNFVSRDFRGLLCELDNLQVAPLLFLWIEKAVHDYLGSSAELLRLVPLLAGLAALTLFWRLARRTIAPLPAAFAVGLMAVASSPIHLSAMVKPYSLDLCLATFLLLLAWRYLQAPNRSGYLFALALLIPLAVAASYPVVFVAGSISLVLLPVVWRQGGRAGWYGYLVFNVLCVTAFAAHLHFVGREVYDPSLPAVKPYMADYWKGGFLPHQPLAALHWVVRCHVGHMLSYPVECNGGGLLGLILAILGARALSCRRQYALLGLCLLPFALNLLAAAIRRYPYAGDQRLEQHLLPGLCLLLGSGLADLLERIPVERVRRVSCAASTGLLTCVALMGAVSDALQPAHDAEAVWARDVARYLRRELRDDDQVVLCQPERATLDCLRWHLQPFRKQVCAAAEIDWKGTTKHGPRLWLVAQTLELAPPARIPPVRDLHVILPAIAGTSEPVLQHTRFLAHTPGPDRHEEYHYCCDLYLVARPMGEPKQLTYARPELR